MEWTTTAMQFLVAYGSLGLMIWAFIDAARFTRADFKTVDKMGRKFWIMILGTAIVLVFWLGSWQPDEPFGPRSLTWLAGLALIGIYFYDMRPKLRIARMDRLTSESTPRGRKRSRTGMKRS